jgi:hypothetical protein
LVGWLGNPFHKVQIRSYLLEAVLTFKNEKQVILNIFVADNLKIFLSWDIFHVQRTEQQDGKRPII